MIDLLSPERHDALCEIFNISVGQSAARLSELVGDEVSLLLPAVRVSTLAELDQRLGISRWREVGTVVQHFGGSVEGDAFFLFPHEDGAALISHVFDRLLDRGGNVDAARDALEEIGNVVLSACLSNLADLLGEPLDCFAPSLFTAHARDLLTRQTSNPQQVVLCLFTPFELEAEQIEGSFCILISLPSIDRLLNGLDQFLDGANQPRNR